MSLKLQKDSKAEDALQLPKGKLIGKDLSGVPGVGMEVSFGPKIVVESADLIIEKGDVNETFYTQAEIISYANNNLVKDKQIDYV